MRRHFAKKTCIGILVFLFSVCTFSDSTAAQQQIIINLAPIDGIPLTPDNAFNYQLHVSQATQAVINGTVRFRGSGLYMSYTLHCSLKQGLNQIKDDANGVQWQFSSPSLQQIFLNYKTLPEGTYEYCVTVTTVAGGIENQNGKFEECLYHRAEDVFLINLIDPENNAKLKEYNPLLTWIANYSFSNELTYRIRVAEIKKGQNPSTAVLRNQPVYDENNLTQNSILYPIYAKPLVANQPYAWTVDAYFNNILLGSSETWQFIIPNDTLQPIAIDTRSYIDISRENGIDHLFILGKIKLKYILEDAKSDNLSLELINEKNLAIKISPDNFTAKFGDNRYVIDLTPYNLKDQAMYTLKINTKTKHEFKLPFKFLNPEKSN